MATGCPVTGGRSTVVALLFSCVLLAPKTFAGAVEGAGAYYWDEGRSVMISSVRGDYATREVWDGAGRETSLGLSYTAKFIDQKEPSELLNEALGEDITKYTENSISADLTQGLGVGTLASAFGGMTESILGSTYNFGARGTQWWLQETLQTSFELRKTVSEAPVIEYTDTDGKRVTTPADLDGTSATVSVMNFATPTTILLGNFSRSTRTDRPDADALSVEVRQFLHWTRSAVHAGLAHYENVGRIEPITQVGSVVANTARLEWHQRLRYRMILMGGYRYHLETEKPRAADAATTQTGSDAVYGSLRYRWGRGAWTSDRHEVYSFLARYTTNTAGLAYVVGLGGRYYF